MSQSIAAQGELTADGTEQTLATVTEPGVYELHVGAHNMALNDDLELRHYTKLRESGEGATSRVSMYTLLEDAQTNEKHYRFGPIVSMIELVTTLKQIAGTNRVYPWVLIRLG